jgi:chorismate dehydratase
MLYKLGAVPYLNALPLIHFLEEKPTLAPPAPLVRLLRIGQVDIATAPITTLFEYPHYSLVPGICIGSSGPVRSVKLFFSSNDITIENIRSIYLDMESRTSALLLKVLLHFKYGRNLDEITFITPIPPRHCEGKLLIGDKAMRELPETPPLDLGYEWTSWTALPFVYAAWISRLPNISEKSIVKLTAARDLGIEKLSSVIPHDTPFPSQLIEEYLQNLIYRMGPKEEEGMELFRDYLLRANLIEAPSAPLKYAVS